MEPFPQRLVLDACVLYPPSLRDLLLTLAAIDAFDVLWSEAILQETERNVLLNHPDLDPARFRQHTMTAMRRAFPDALVPPGHVDDERLEGVHPGDRHVVATAVAGHADAIVTINVRHVPVESLTSVGLVRLTPATSLRGWTTSRRRSSTPRWSNLSRRWTNPPRTVPAILGLLAGHPTMAKAVERIGRRRSRS